MKFNTGAFIILLIATFLLIIGFKHISNSAVIRPAAHHYAFKQAQVATVGQIPLPDGYTRCSVPPGAFAQWLRSFKLRSNNTVYLYNGQPADRQDMQYAVLNLTTGTKNLQQCADAIMRLRAEYYFARKEYGKIEFVDGKKKYNFGDYSANIEATSDTHRLLMGFLENVFINCGTYTVNTMSNPIPLTSMQPGDMFVKAGSPGHAMIVMDVAQNAAGQKIYLLAQSYMPAQDMHIVVNPGNTALNPWYQANDGGIIVTPGFVFLSSQLKRWR